MSCAQHRDHFTELLDDALTAERRAELERHLEDCGACTQVLSTMRATVGALARLPPEPPPARLRMEVLDAFVARHGRTNAARTTAWLTPARGWTLAATVVALSFLLSLVSEPGGELARPGAPKLCLPVIAAAGLLPACALLCLRVWRRRRAPVSLFALVTAAGSLAGQLALLAACPMLEARVHVLVLHSGVLTAVTLLGALLAFAQRRLPAT